MPLDDRAIAISATFTAEAIEPGLAFWAQEVGLNPGIRFGGYSQVFQDLLDPAGLFASNRDGFNVALVRLQDWANAGVDASAERLAQALRSEILVICPSPGRFDAAERRLVEAAAYSITPAEIEALYPVEQVHDPHADELGHVPYTPVYFVALATAIARKIHSIASPPYKVIALDCDDTLWDGICGEDGPQNVVIDPPRRALQEFMAERRREGMLLALCSKNNEDDVIETFRAHPDMPLRLEDFAARRLNWESKPANLASIAQELELGLDSFILVDDSQKECSEAKAGAPEVLALPLPTRADEIPIFLRHVWAFDRARITEEDRRRAEMYAQRGERNRAERSATSFEEYLASLELEVRIEPMRSEKAARVAQLTQRTNQMNASCIRRTEAQIRGLDAEILTVDVKDRFGSYGIVGVMIFRAEGKVLVADTFLLSCRALGRGVEQRMVERLREIARERGQERVEIPFVPSERNRPAALFLESLEELTVR
jgi:FkbH-like protein